MTQSNATTLPLSVKVVRECANRTLDNQREHRDDKLAKIVEQRNAAAVRYNHSMLKRFLKRPDRPLEDIETTIEAWKELWVSGKMDVDHPGYFPLSISRTTWWKRLRQFGTLPESDDDKIMMVSMQDLDLIDYSLWKA